MKLNGQMFLRGALLLTYCCFATVAQAQSQSGAGGAKPVMPVPIVKPKSSIEVMTPGLALTPPPVLRTNLNATSKTPLTFKKVPGGIVFGLPAKFTTDELARKWAGADLQQDDSGWSLHAQRGESLRLPNDQASFLVGALAFARNQAAGDWLVDIGADGAVTLAETIQNTRAGIVAVRSDLVPQFFLPIYAGGKSLIVDREVRMSVHSNELRFDADLELRFYRPGRNPGGEELAERVGTIPLLTKSAGSNQRPLLSAPEGPNMAIIASHLDRLSALAGWIGFFRWAKAADVTGLDALEQSLRRTAKVVRTPFLIKPEGRAAWVSGSTALPPSEVPEWMRQHRERVLNESK